MIILRSTGAGEDQDIRLLAFYITFLLVIGGYCNWAARFPEKFIGGSSKDIVSKLLMALCFGLIYLLTTTGICIGQRADTDDPWRAYSGAIASCLVIFGAAAVSHICMAIVGLTVCWY